MTWERIGLAGALVIAGCAARGPLDVDGALDPRAGDAGAREEALDAASVDPAPPRDAGAIEDAPRVGATRAEDAGMPLDAGVPRDVGDAGPRADATGGDAPWPDAAARADAAVRTTCGAGAPPRLRVLFVGNSQIDVHDLPRIVADLAAESDPSCPRIDPDRFTIGGANLGDLLATPRADGRRLGDVLASGEHDVVVIAESIDLAELRPPYPERFRADATEIVERARAAGVLPILYATPYPERPEPSGFRAMADPQIALGGELAVAVARGGLGWLRAWAERPALDLYDPDRAHPGHRGSYLSACVILAAITGASPVGLPHGLSIACDAPPCPGVTADEADVLQRAAWAEHLSSR